MTFQLKTLGPYRIEKAEEYAPGGSESSYVEIIRVRGSGPDPPCFIVPSHLFKHSESELGLYLNDRKNLWRALRKLLKVRIDITDKEIMVNFPISLFPDVAKIVPFVRKRGLTGKSELAKSIGGATQFKKRARHKTTQNESRLKENNLPHTIAPYTPKRDTISGQKDGGQGC